MKPFCLVLLALLLAGCSSSGVVSMGGNSYMIAKQGSSLSTKTALEAKCLEEANEYCSQRSLKMIPVSSTGRNGLPVPFGYGGSCDLMFKAVKPGSPEDKPVAMVRTTQ